MKIADKILLALLGLLWELAPLQAEPLNVGVAANFAPTLETITKRFTTETGQEIKVSVASTGTLYAQIVHGAPYDVFLAADQARPRKLEQKGMTEARFTYAFGRLVLWVPGSERSVDESWLETWRGRLAIANPSLAPYGAAALEVIERLDARPKQLIKGNNVAQAFGFIDSGNVPAGLVSLAQLRQLCGDRNTAAKDYWLIPDIYHSPVEQQGVVVKNAQKSAHEFAAFLRSAPVRGIIETDGYDLARQ